MAIINTGDGKKSPPGIDRVVSRGPKKKALYRPGTG